MICITGDISIAPSLFLVGFSHCKYRVLLLGVPFKVYLPLASCVFMMGSKVPSLLCLEQEAVTAWSFHLGSVLFNSAFT